VNTILVVDDLAIYRETIEAALCAEGFTVVTACDGAQAVTALSNQPFDVVLLDLGLPVIPGMGVLQHLRADPRLRHLPVIILSAEAERERVIEAIKLGISGYLVKSQFSLKALLEITRKALAAPAGAVATAPARGPAQATGNAVAPELGASTRPVKPAARSATAPASTWAGAGADLKALRPLISRTDVLKRISADGELTGFSPTVSLVLQLTASPRCSMDEVAKAVGQDHAVALKVLKIANSSAYAGGDRVHAVHKAVLKIGMQNIRQAVLNIGVVEHFGSAAFDGHLSTPLFWEHSIACGIIAAELATALKHKAPDAAFTAGLLHDLGRILFAQHLGEDYVRVLEAARALQLPLEQVEARLLQTSHADVMSKVLGAWHFPPDLVDPITLHHTEACDAKTTASRQTTEVLRLGLADRIAHAMMLGSSGNDTIYPIDEHCRLLGVGPATVRHLEDTVRSQTDEQKFSLLASSDLAAWPSRVEQVRGQLAAPFRPLYVSVAPELDAYRIFCDGLAGPRDGEGANIAVVRIASAKEREPLADTLLTEERKAGTVGLPLLVISPAADVVLPDRVTRSRDHRLLVTPVPESRLMTAVNELLAEGATVRAAA